MAGDGRHRSPRGFALAAILMVMAALLLLAVGLLALAGTERKTARSYVDLKRADWVARAGLEEVRSLLREETANDDFLVLARPGEHTERDALDYLFLARGGSGEAEPEFRMRRLFSGDRESFASRGELPDPEAGGSEGAGFRPLPWAELARVGWHEFENGKGEVVGRYAYWVEDLQGRLAATAAGNGLDGGGHARIAWPLPAAAECDGDLSVAEEPSLATTVQLAAFAIDPEVRGDRDDSDLDNRLRENADLLVSPGSALAAAGLEPPFERGGDGRLLDGRADAVERLVAADRSAYLECPRVPFVAGIDPAVRGRPKRNLNRLLASESRAGAVDDFASWVAAALPDFARRAGGFPDDYLRTLAAGAFDYADEDGDPTLGDGFRGVDSHPLLSEVFLRIQYEGIELSEGRKYLVWEFRLFAELWNLGSRPASGTASVSYENGLQAVQVASLPPLPRFDAERLLLDPAVSMHSLSLSGGRFWSPAIEVELRPDEYAVFEFATVRQRIDIGPSSGPDALWVTDFFLEEPLGAAGIGLRWNGVEADRVAMLVRDSEGLAFSGDRRQVAVKAAIPGHSYGPYGMFVNNPGDPRISRFLRREAAGENSYPRNASPGRRNIRRGTIYDVDRSPRKPRHYGRVLPSEWPDGGHDSKVGNWKPGGDVEIEPTDPRLLGLLPEADAATAPQRLSNAGRFLSPTELGHVFDPVMWRPAYADLPGAPGSGRADSRRLLGEWPVGAELPEGRDGWPAVTLASEPSPDYGGGNTLRIGRPEHPRFDEPRLRAVRLLDLFHCGRPWSADAEQRQGPLVAIRSQVNLNTAPVEVIRTLLVGELRQDPRAGRVTGTGHAPAPWMAPRVAEEAVATPARERAADLLAEAVVAGRPYFSRSELATLKDASGRAVFGNREWFADGGRLRWSDAAAEELFARLFQGSTLRSRNFRVWVIGQSLVPRRAGSDEPPQVLAESRKVFQLFANPGERDEQGGIVAENFEVEVRYENDF